MWWETVIALATEWTDPGFMGAAVTSITWITLAIGIGQNPKGVNDEKTKKATYVDPGLGQAAVSICTTARDRSSSPSGIPVPDRAPMSQNLSFNELNFPLPRAKPNIAKPCPLDKLHQDVRPWHIVQSIVIFVNGSQSRTYEIRHGHSARDGLGVVTEGVESALCESFETNDVGETARDRG